jgi:hypothetical protein
MSPVRVVQGGAVQTVLGAWTAGHEAWARRPAGFEQDQISGGVDHGGVTVGVELLRDDR